MERLYGRTAHSLQRRSGFCNLKMLPVCHDLVTMMNFTPSAQDHPSRTFSNDQQTRTASCEVAWNLQATLLYDAWILRPANIDTEVFGRTTSPSRISATGLSARLPGQSYTPGCPLRYPPQWVGHPLIFRAKIQRECSAQFWLISSILATSSHPTGYLPQWHFQVLLEYYTHTVDNLPA